MKALHQALAAVLLPGIALCATAAPQNDYPTAARAEYVFGCMEVNGQTPEMLAKCSCSIDVIASLLPFERYERAETVMRISQVQGPQTAMFREAKWANALVADLKRAQAQSTLRCF